MQTIESLEKKTKSQLGKQLVVLLKEIEQHNDSYYNETPDTFWSMKKKRISDKAYDLLLSQFEKQVEKLNDGDEKAELLDYFYSNFRRRSNPYSTMTKVYDLDKLKTELEQLLKKYGKLYITPKYDGLAVKVEVVNGQVVSIRAGDSSGVLEYNSPQVKSAVKVFLNNGDKNQLKGKSFTVYGELMLDSRTPNAYASLGYTMPRAYLLAIAKSGKVKLNGEIKFIGENLRVIPYAFKGQDADMFKLADHTLQTRSSLLTLEDLDLALATDSFTSFILNKMDEACSSTAQPERDIFFDCDGVVFSPVRPDYIFDDSLESTGTSKRQNNFFQAVAYKWPEFIARSRNY